MFYRIKDTSLKYPFVNASCEDLLNSKHKHVQLMQELKKKDRLSMQHDLPQFIIGKFCISPGNSMHQTADKSSEHQHDR
jgi:hypothetical protein